MHTEANEAWELARQRRHNLTLRFLCQLTVLLGSGVSHGAPKFFEMGIKRENKWGIPSCLWSMVVPFLGSLTAMGWHQQRWPISIIWGWEWGNKSLAGHANSDWTSTSTEHVKLLHTSARGVGVQLLWQLGLNIPPMSKANNTMTPCPSHMFRSPQDPINCQNFQWRKRNPPYWLVNSISIFPLYTVGGRAATFAALRQTGFSKETVHWGINHPKRHLTAETPGDLGQNVEKAQILAEKGDGMVESKTLLPGDPAITAY